MKRAAKNLHAGATDSSELDMPCPPRLDLARIPQHAIQRGNDRHACFFHGDDYRTYSASSSAFEAYRALFADALSEERLMEIRAYVQQQKALGGSKFQAQIEAVLGRYVRVRPRTPPRILRRLSTENGL